MARTRRRCRAAARARWPASTRAMPATTASRHVAADYTRFLKPDALQGRALRRAAQAMGFTPDVDAAMERAIAALQGRRRRPSSTSEIATHGQWDDAEFEVLLYEFKAGLNDYLAARGRAAADRSQTLIAWNKAHAKAEMPVFGQEIFEKAQAKGPLTDRGLPRGPRKIRRLAGPMASSPRSTGSSLDAVIAPSDVAGLAHRPRARRTTSSARDMAWPRSPVPEHHSADGRRAGLAGRHRLHGPRMERSRSCSGSPTPSSRRPRRASRRSSSRTSTRACAPDGAKAAAALRNARSVACAVAPARPACARSASRSPAPARS